MFWVLRIAHCFEELVVTGCAADVLGRAAACDVCQTRVEFAGDGVVDLADFDLVVPAVAEVVEIVDRTGAGVLDDLDQSGLVGGQVFAAEVRVGQPSCRATGLKHVEVRVSPAHGGLDGQVEAVEADIGRHLQGAYDSGLDIFKLDLQLDDAHGPVPLSGLCNSRAGGRR